MQPNEKKMLMLMSVLAVLVLVLRVVPMLFDHYRDGRQEIALLQERIDRYQSLMEDSAQWREREQQKRKEIEQYQQWIFEGSNPGLVGPGVQRTLRQAVAQAGVSVREMSVARYSLVGDWLIVQQDVSFTLTQDMVLPLLQAVEELRPRLHIAAFSITHNRRQYLGNMTVVGFSHRAPHLLQTEVN
jgi:hypothetical protein